MSEEQKAYYRQKLDGFETISVREKTGKRLLEEATDKSVRVDVDPVLLLDTEKWKNVMSSRFNGKKYMLLYMLRPMPELLEFAKNVAILFFSFGLDWESKDISWQWYLLTG